MEKLTPREREFLAEILHHFYEVDSEVYEDENGVIDPMSNKELVLSVIEKLDLGDYPGRVW